MNSSILLERFGINPINFKGRELELIKNDNDVYDGFFKSKKNKFLYHYDNLIFECKKLNNAFWQAYDVLQEFYDLVDYNTFKEAAEYIEYIAQRLDNVGNQTLSTVAKSLRKWKTGIANAYAKNKWNLQFHNGVAEGNNNRLSTILKMAYGYHNFKRYRARALLILSVKKI